MTTTMTFSEQPHPDDIAVDLFAAAMKEKLAARRAQGRGAWEFPRRCSIEDLQVLLVEQVRKGDAVEVATFAMMLWHRGGAATAQVCTWRLDNDGSGVWTSACGESWSFIDGGPKENGVTYCQHCGREIVPGQPDSLDT